jgi:DNA-3-methyladenine glycosylase
LARRKADATVTRSSRATSTRSTLDVARIVGCARSPRTRAGLAARLIVEVEAYIGEADPACHAAPGKTRRNAPLYGPPGFAYVYLNYGMHYLVNAVTEPEASPAAVLIRALEPIEGGPDAALQRARHRATAILRDSRSVPGSHLTRVWASASRERWDLMTGGLWIEDRAARRGLAWSRWIGINGCGS